ncbi:MAG: rhomboid family intramembrane serine protease [Eubacteriaceae bacterium]|nr:rhomboid family intramembrane serine protease [Eubacteriaceae bacterium]
MLKGKKLRLDFNAPVILSFTILSFIMLVANGALSRNINQSLAIYRSSLLSLDFYLRLFTYVFAHADFSHFANNFLLILAIGPIVEEKYGSKRLLIMMAVTAVVSGLLHAIFFPKVMLVGASGIAFLLILLASFTNVKEGYIPVTFMLVSILYIGTEVFNSFSKDNISQLTHIAGGCLGSFYGFFYRGGKRK